MKAAVCSGCGTQFPSLVPDNAHVITCFKCDQMEPSMIDPDLSVYAVPTRIVLHAEVYVLARSLQDARVQAQKLDLAEHFVYDDEKFEVDDLPHAKINDFRSIGILDTPTKDSEPVLQPDYPVVDHPDYDADRDDIPDEPETEGMQALARSHDPDKE